MTILRSLAALLIVCLAGAGHQARLRDLEGRFVDPLSSTERAVSVFLFVGPDCPISNRYAPELTRLYERFHVRGVTFTLVYPGNLTRPEEIRRHVREYAYPLRALRDPDFSFVDAVGATVTPEAAVFDARGTLRYVGRIDDRYVSAGQMRPAATRHDLADAIEAVVSGRQVESTRTPAIGCLIADLR